MKKATAVLAVLVLALGAGTAAANVTKFPAHFKTFKFKGNTSGGTFKGKLASQKHPCIKDRKVKIFRKHNGNKTKLGSDRSNDKGKWKIEVGGGKLGNGKGRYYAKVKKKKFNNGNKVCATVTSPTLKIS